MQSDLSNDKQKHVGEQIARALVDINSILEEEMQLFVDQLPVEVSEIVTYLFKQGGKRLRPVLFYIIAQELGTQTDISPYALAVELIHTMSLYHDDLIDGAIERRGAPTVHTRWDEPTAIVGGDVLHSLIHRHILKSASQKRIDRKNAVTFLENLLDIEVEIGSNVIHEMWMARSNQIPSMESALRVSAGKTAPLFAFSARNAGLISSREDITSTLYKFGYEFGTAFQLLDDLLDYFPSDKDIGGDLREGKKTPLIVLISKKDPVGVNTLVGNVTIQDNDVIKFRDKHKESFLEIITIIDKHLNSARKILQEIGLSESLDLLFHIIYSKIHQMKKELQVS